MCTNAFNEMSERVLATHHVVDGKRLRYDPTTFQIHCVIADTRHNVWKFVMSLQSLKYLCIPLLHKIYCMTPKQPGWSQDHRELLTWSQIGIRLDWFTRRNRFSTESKVMLYSKRADNRWHPAFYGQTIGVSNPTLTLQMLTACYMYTEF